MRAAFVAVVVSFSSFTDDRRGRGAGVIVGPRALVVFSGFATSTRVVLLTDAPGTFPGSLTTYEVIPCCDSSPARWGIRVIVVDGRGARILRPACKTVCAAIRSVVATSRLAASCFLYALTWASYCRVWRGSGWMSWMTSWVREPSCCCRKWRRWAGLRRVTRLSHRYVGCRLLQEGANEFESASRRLAARRS